MTNHNRQPPFCFIATWSWIKIAVLDIALCLQLHTSKDLDPIKLNSAAGNSVGFHLGKAFKEKELKLIHVAIICRNDELSSSCVDLYLFTIQFSDKVLLDT